MGRKKILPKKVIKKKNSRNEQNNFLVGFLTVCIALIVLILVSKTIPPQVFYQIFSTSTYKDNFPSGKQVIWYDDSGIFMYDASSKKNLEMVNFPLLQMASNPMLSPDNKKIAYVVQTTNYPDAKFELWVYDLTTKRNILLVKGFKSGSSSPYTWAKDSGSLFVILLTENVHKLFKVTLAGAKTLLTSDYSGEVYPNLSGPDVINDRFVAFSTCDSQCEKRIGIVETGRKKIFYVEVPKEADKTKMLALDDNHVLQANIFELPKAQRDETERVGKNNIIVGLEKVSLTTQKVEHVSLPKEISLYDDQRIQVAGVCGNDVLVGMVGIRDREEYKEEYYTHYFLYNIHEQKLIRFADAWGCDRQGQIYTTSSSIHEPLAIERIDLANVNESKNIKYSGLLSKEILEQVRNGCLGIGMLATGANNTKDFVYVDIGTYMGTQAFTQDETLCDKTVIEDLSGIYRLSHSENTVVKLNKGYSTFHRFSLLEPN